jgi:hypothetical protein
MAMDLYAIPSFADLVSFRAVTQPIGFCFLDAPQ